MESKEEKERKYQKLLLERAIKENVILCLPTGSGKTLIAINLIKHMLPAAIRDKKKIVFLANKVHLINQQGKYIQAQVGNTSEDGVNTVAIISGDLNTDFWKDDKWNEVLDTCHILVITSEIFKQILILHSYISLEEVGLIIFDECHHATGGDPMARIIDDYATKFRQPNLTASLPRILGLTATIINTAGKLHKMEQDILDVQSKFCSRVITHVDHSELKGYSTSARMEIKTYADYAQSPDLDWNYRDLGILKVMSAIVDMIDGIRHKKIPDGAITHSSYQHPEQLFFSGKTLDKILKAVLQDVIGAYMDLGPYCAKLAAKTNLAYLEAILDQASLNDDVAITQSIETVITALEKFILTTEGRLAAFDKDLQLKIFISDKLTKLIMILLEWRGNNAQERDKCGLVFVQKRVTAQVLHWYFQDAKEFLRGNFEMLETDFVVGSSGSRWGLDYENMHYTSKRQTEALTKFRNKETNLIFTTNVLEEGLDVRDCNLGVRFDKVENYPSYVQSLGRVRQPKAPFYVMVETKTLNAERDKVTKFEAYDFLLTQYLIKKSIDEDEDDELNIGQNPALLGEEFQPFCPEGLIDSPTVTLDTSIQLVYRYCSTLPCDQFAPLCPYSWWEELDESKPKFRAYLQFPSNSVIQDVLISPIVPSKKLAKQVVHLQACRLLYRNDALDNHLLPITVSIPKAANEFIQSLRDEILLDGKSTDKKVGTKKRTQWYQKAIPKVYGVPSSATANRVLYVLKLRTRSSHSGNSDSKTSGLYDFDSKLYSFGLLVDEKISHEFDMIPPFPLFGKSTTREDSLVMASLEKLAVIKISTEELHKLRTIQHQVFAKILRLGNPLLVESPLKDSWSPLVVPLFRNDENHEIWWDILPKLDSMDMNDFCANPSAFQYSTTANGNFSPDNYHDAIVVPCCKERYESIQLTDLFCVIQTDYAQNSNSINPESRTTPKETYLEYFETKHKDLNIKIKNPDLPLLKTKNIGQNLQFLSRKGDKIQSKKAIKASKECYYPPDLVVIYPIPASIFIQAKFLPSCIHRISRLLLSLQIQQSVAEKFDWSIAGKNNREEVPVEMEFVTDDDENEGSNTDQLNKDFDNEIPNFKKMKLASPERNDEKNPISLKSTIELEYIHPDKIERGTAIKAFRDKASFKNSAVPKIRNPVNFYKPRFCLRPLKAIEFKSLDEQANFEMEAGPSIFTIAEALTLANAQDVLSLENLEFIGDSVLKLFSSTHVYFHFPQANEGQMTSLRNQLISNAHFYIRGKEKRLGGILASGIFHPEKTWTYPEVELQPNVASALARNDTTCLGIFANIPLKILQEMTPESFDSLLEQEFKKEENDQTKGKDKPAGHTTYSHSRLGDKNIADCVEALVGAYYKCGGIVSAARVMAWLGLRAPTAAGEILNYSLTCRLDEEAGTPNQNVLDFVQRHMSYIEELEQRISHRFKNRVLLFEACCYPNFVNSNINIGCYQRLEFLGDAILDFLICNHIHSNVKVKSPGELTLLKSSLVNNFTLACLSVKYELHKYLQYSQAKSLQDAIDGFVEYQESRENLVSGDDLPLKSRKLWKSQHIAESLTVPKVLGDIFEALVGAIYIDSGLSLDHTWRVIYRLMGNEIESFTHNIPKNVTMELYESYPDPKPVFSVVEDENVESCATKSTTVKLTIGDADFFAVGRNKKEAKQAAAKWALETLKKKNNPRIICKN